MNAVVHAGSGAARISHDGIRRIQVQISDQGKGIAEDAIHRATLERGYSSAGTLGHGFWIMLKTADHVYLLTGPEGTTVVLEQNVAPAEPGWLDSPVR
jgi:anti-sigma regulatory factor (Ser/Thr protein kinase)